MRREEILVAATKIVDEEGLDALSMRKVAKALSVGAMTLYNHVKSKDDLLDGITDLLAERFSLPEGAAWKPALRGSALSAHDVLLKHPWGCALMATRPSIGPARMAYYDAILGTLRRAGFSPRLARKGFLAIDAHVLGFTQQEASMPIDDPNRDQMATEMVASLPQKKYPYLVEMIEDLVSTDDYSPPFLEVLDWILDGLESSS